MALYIEKFFTVLHSKRNGIVYKENFETQLFLYVERQHKKKDNNLIKKYHMLMSYLFFVKWQSFLSSLCHMLLSYLFSHVVCFSTQTQVLLFRLGSNLQKQDTSL